MSNQASSALSNPQYVFVALMDKAGEELCKWLESHLHRYAGKMWWKRNVCGVLNDKEQRKIENQSWAELRDLDVHLLLKVLDRNYRFLKPKLKLPDDGRDLIYEVRQIRNRCIGHRPIRGNNQVQLICDIRTLEIFSDTILNSNQLVKDCKCLSLQVKEIKPKPVENSHAKAQNVATAPEHNLQEQPSSSVQHTASLLNMFTGVELTPSQKSALQSIESFLQDERQNCFVLKGYAGTGKTFLIDGIVRYLKLCKKSPQLLAPTGRAAHVMKERHRLPASTIHRHIYVLDKLREFREIGERGTITYKFYFELKNNDTQHDSVFIIDESSMLSDIYTESEFMRFGSGRLLRDLLEYINFDGNDYRKKVIFVGDNAQLPPVDMSYSPALDESYLEKYVHSTVPSTVLTDVVRQEEGGLIVKNATAFRTMLVSGNYATFEFESNGESVKDVSPENFIPSYLEYVSRAGVCDSIIITHSNALAKDYNTSVRQSLFPNAKLLEPNDRVMIVKNNYNYEIELFNGQIGSVLYASNEVETHTVYVNVGLDDKGTRNNKKVELHFRKSVIRFMSLQGSTHDIQCLCIADLLTSSHRELSSEQSKALYVDFKQRHKGLTPDSAEFREALRSDPYFNALQLKYAYAITCHKAQGGEWNSVYVDFFHKNKLNSDSVRWSYTALTRAAKTVVATNTLHHNLLTPLKQRNSLMSEGKASAITMPESVNELPDILIDASSVDKQIYGHLKSLLPADYSIDSFKASSYLAQWEISKDSSSCLVKIYYNNKSKISNVFLENASDDDWVVPLKEIAAKLKGTRLTLTGKDYSPTSTDLTSSHHDAFVEAIKKKCEGLGVGVYKVADVSPFHMRITYTKDEDKFFVNYYFNSSNQFTSKIPEDSLPNELLKVIDSIHS